METTSNSTKVEAGITTLATILKTPKSTIMTTVVQRVGMAAASIVEDIVTTIITASNNKMGEMTTCGSPTCVTACLKDVTSHLPGSVERGLGWASVYASLCRDTTLHCRTAAMESTTSTTRTVLLVEGKATSVPGQAWPLTATPLLLTRTVRRPVWWRSPDENQPGRIGKTIATCSCLCLYVHIAYIWSYLATEFSLLRIKLRLQWDFWTRCLLFSL